MLFLIPVFESLREGRKMADFLHRLNDDGSFDSICLKCFRTVSSHRLEAKLEHDETRHTCESDDLHYLETKGHYRRPKDATPRRKT